MIKKISLIFFYRLEKNLHNKKAINQINLEMLKIKQVIIHTNNNV